jgi:excisionase family DNA binding protein
VIEPVKLLYSRQETAEALSLSVSTVDVLIGRGMLRARRQGRRVLVPSSEIQRFAKREVARLWPEKRNGMTVRGYRYGSPRSHRRMEEIDLREESSSRQNL